MLEACVGAHVISDSCPFYRIHAVVAGNLPVLWGRGSKPVGLSAGKVGTLFFSPFQQ